MTTLPIIIERDTEVGDASQLLGALDRDHEFWAPAPNNWVFRGHADAAWCLLPTALRGGSLLGDGRDRTTAPVNDPLEQAELEYRTVLRFLEEADGIGLPVPPEAKVAFRKVFLDSPLLQRKPTLKTDGNGVVTRVYPERDEFFRDWPVSELLTAVAVARHHGVRTRLLDWTYNPLVAAYFAASEAAKWVTTERFPREGITHLAVWSFSRAHVQRLSHHYHRLNCVAEVVHCPRSWAGRQAAQLDLFTVMRRIPKDRPDFHEIDRFFESCNEHFGAAFLGPPATYMRRILMPVKHAPVLLRKLAERFVNAATVFRDYAGAAQAVEERFYWDG